MFYGPPLPQASPVQPNSLSYVHLPLSDLLSEARETNGLLKSILAILTNGPDWQQRATKSFDPEIFERVACLERQIADLRP